MAPVMLPLTALPAARPEVFCPDCGYELQPWEVHLLKYLSCAYCGAGLRLGAPVELHLIDA